MQVVLMPDPAFPPRARAWVDELPDLPSTRLQVVHREIEAQYSLRSNKSTAALEVFIPRGGRFIYGLLGADFIPSDSGKLIVEVAGSEPGSTVTDWSLARELDAVRVGIPTWAVEEILDGASEAANTQLISSGNLRYILGAYGEMGSNNWVFRCLALAVANLFSLESPLSGEGLSSIVRQHFS
jgi:hypothetical protein